MSNSVRTISRKEKKTIRFLTSQGCYNQTSDTAYQRFSELAAAFKISSENSRSFEMNFQKSNSCKTHTVGEIPASFLAKLDLSYHWILKHT